MTDKLIGADALTRAIVDSPSDISGYNPVYCNGVAKRQLEILDIVLNMNGTTEGEIRAKAIDEFAEMICIKCEEMACTTTINGMYMDILTLDGITDEVMEIAEQLKGGAE